MNHKLSRITAAILAVILLMVLIPLFVNKLMGSSDSKNEMQIRLHMEDEKVEILPLEDYLVGVVAAEMPAEFQIEALKAQAVAARTYVLKRKSEGSASGAVFDVDTTEKTQVWISTQEMIKKWGLINYWKYHRKIARAVEETRGVVITYNGKLIDAVYHSSCGRKETERAGEVWSSDVGYLINVPSGENDTSRFVKYLSFDTATFYKLLGFSQIPNRLTSSDILILERTKAGRVKTLVIRNRIFEGTDFRNLLKLPSTDFEWKISPERIEIMVYGNGHAVGMSQYGANDLAKAGNGYKEILTHYYQGTKINKIT